MKGNPPTHRIFVLPEGKETQRWQPVGVGFTNRDGSLNFTFDVPLALSRSVRLQVRAIEPQKEEEVQA